MESIQRLTTIGQEAPPLARPRTGNEEKCWRNLTAKFEPMEQEREKKVLPSNQKTQAKRIQVIQESILASKATQEEK